MTAADTNGAVGFVGLGNMGAPMVRNLAQAGIAVVGYDAVPDRAAALAGDDPQIAAAASLSDIAQAARQIVLMLPDSDVVDAVAAELMARLQPGSLIVDMSSSFPPRTQALGRRLEAAGHRLIDAPVSGGVVRAVSGTLSIMAGGARGDIDAAERIFAPLGSVFCTGPLGSGHATKALNNYLSASSLIATAEALLIGQAFGLDGGAMNAVFDNATGKSNTTSNKVGAYFLPETYNSGFALALLEKDVGMAREMAAALDVPAETLAHISDQLQRSKEALRPDADHTEVHAWLKQRASNG
ncbi:MAG: NAD(P)-dependent oxidoreductase [Pseudomonadota bacterium]